MVPGVTMTQKGDYEQQIRKMVVLQHRRVARRRRKRRAKIRNDSSVVHTIRFDYVPPGSTIQNSRRRNASSAKSVE